MAYQVTVKQQTQNSKRMSFSEYGNVSVSSLCHIFNLPAEVFGLISQWMEFADIMVLKNTCKFISFLCQESVFRLHFQENPSTFYTKNESKSHYRKGVFFSMASLFTNLRVVQIISSASISLVHIVQLPPTLSDLQMTVQRVSKGPMDARVSLESKFPHLEIFRFVETSACSSDCHFYKLPLSVTYLTLHSNRHMDSKSLISLLPHALIRLNLQGKFDGFLTSQLPPSLELLKLNFPGEFFIPSNFQKLTNLQSLSIKTAVLKESSLVNLPPSLTHLSIPCTISEPIIVSQLSNLTSLKWNLPNPPRVWPSNLKKLKIPARQLLHFTAPKLPSSLTKLQITGNICDIFRNTLEFPSPSSLLHLEVKTFDSLLIRRLPKSLLYLKIRPDQYINEHLIDLPPRLQVLEFHRIHASQSEPIPYFHLQSLPKTIYHVKNVHVLVNTDSIPALSKELEQAGMKEWKIPDMENFVSATTKLNLFCSELKWSFEYELSWMKYFPRTLTTLDIESTLHWGEDELKCLPPLLKHLSLSSTSRLIDSSLEYLPNTIETVRFGGVLTHFTSQLAKFAPVNLRLLKAHAFFITNDLISVPSFKIPCINMETLTEEFMRTVDPIVLESEHSNCLLQEDWNPDGTFPLSHPEVVTTLSLMGSTFTEAGFFNKYLPRMTRLETLKLERNLKISDSVVSILPISLTSLLLKSNNKLTNNALKLLPVGLKTLRLEFGKSNNLDKYLMFLPPGLTSLDLQESFITHNGIPMLPKSLVYLWLPASTKFFASLLQFRKDLPKLKQISINSDNPAKNFVVNEFSDS